MKEILTNILLTLLLALMVVGCSEIKYMAEGERTGCDCERVKQHEEQEYISLGVFKISHYCSCGICTGQYTTTATGRMPVAGRTIATDPKVIPLGSIVIINGQEYIAEDVGGGIKSKKIDMYVASHQEALSLGVKYVEVFIKK